MSEFRPYKALASINSASPAEASDLFALCAGSPVWAERMTEARPFKMLEDVYSAAEIAWFAAAANERIEDIETYTSVEKRLDALLEDLGAVEAVTAEAS